MCLAVGELSCNKCCGNDLIPSEVFRNAPAVILSWLTAFFNCTLSHNHLSSDVTDVLIRPDPKSNLKDPTISANYRPISPANCASKIIETIILRKIHSLLSSSGNQFVFLAGTFDGYVYSCCQGNH